MGKQLLKKGEKVMFVMFGLFFVIVMIGYAMLETYRITSDKPIFVQRTHFDFSPEGKQGSELYRLANCNSCHRALRSGTSMGLSLDGIGSKYSLERIHDFLINPEDVYGAPTIDHGTRPKEAAYVANMPKEDLRLIAIFLSELKADAGSSVAKTPPPGRSPFIDTMIGSFAPENWKEKYQDIRDKTPLEPEQHGTHE